MSEEKDYPHWAEVGSDVVVVTHSGYGYGSAKATKVSRHTATRVVVETGEWFPKPRFGGKADCLIRSGSDRWSSAVYLYSPSHPLAKTALAEQADRRLAYDVSSAYETWNRDKKNRAAARALATAATRYAERKKADS